VTSGNEKEQLHFKSICPEKIILGTYLHFKVKVLSFAEITFKLQLCQAKGLF
jgi:hypothetical protein